MMKECPLFVDNNSPEGLQVFQLTDDPKGASATYPDLPSFLADGRRLVLNTSDGPVICDPDDGGSLRPIFPAGEGKGITVSYDGRYGFFSETVTDGDGSLTVSRVDLETLEIEELFHADGLMPGTDLRADRFSFATVSSDNRRLATCLWLGDGNTADAPFGIYCLDLDRGKANFVVADVDFYNPHLRYCPSTVPEASHDLLVQMNHGSHFAPDGTCLLGLGPISDLGVDIHAVRDDGSNWRDLPFGRDGIESNIGHQIWRGRGTSVVTVTLQNPDISYGWADGTEQGVVAGWPILTIKDQPHRGALISGARRVVLSEGYTRPRFCHLASDTTGLKFVFDTFPIYDGNRAGMLVIIGSAPNEESPLNFRYLLNSGVVFTGMKGHDHAHPILSPDGGRLFFNSNMTGVPQAYMATGFSF